MLTAAEVQRWLEEERARQPRPDPAGREPVPGDGSAADPANGPVTGSTTGSAPVAALPAAGRGRGPKTLVLRDPMRPAQPGPATDSVIGPVMAPVIGLAGGPAIRPAASAVARAPASPAPGLPPGFTVGPVPARAANLSTGPAAIPPNFPASIIAGSEPDRPVRRRPWALSLAVGLVAGLALGAGLVRLAGAAPPWLGGAREEAAVEPEATVGAAEVEVSAAPAAPEVVAEVPAAAVPAAPPASPVIAPSGAEAVTMPTAPSAAPSPDLPENPPAVSPDAPPEPVVLAPRRGGPGPVPGQAGGRSAPRASGPLATPEGASEDLPAVEVASAAATDAGWWRPEPLPQPPAGEALRLAAAAGQPAPDFALPSPTLPALLPDDPLAPPPGPPVARAPVAPPVTPPAPEAGGAGAEARVALHLPPALSRDSVRAAEAALGAAGFDLADTSIAGFGVAQSEVRFFYPEDAAEAARIAAAIGATARDFSAYRPAPAPGTLDVWLAQDG